MVGFLLLLIVVSRPPGGRPRRERKCELSQKKMLEKLLRIFPLEKLQFPNAHAIFSLDKGPEPEPHAMYQ